MLVGFDYQIFTLQEFGGISRYICSLAKELSSLADVRARIIAPLHINSYLRGSEMSDLRLGQFVHRLPKTGLLIAATSGALFRPVSRVVRPDVVHETYYSTKATCGLRVPRVLTVYDMIHELFPDAYAPNDPTSRRKAAAVKRADHVLCISESTRRDLLERHGLPEDRVSVTHLACDVLPEAGPDVQELVGDGAFLLYVGARSHYKNFYRLLEAYAASAWLQGNFRLVCFGGGALTVGERARMHELGVPEVSVVQVGGGDERLATLYRNAAAFIYPSLYEGFGIPPLEAMSAGCPVVCSQTSSIPEVVGDAGEYFDPQQVDSIRSAIERVLRSSEYRQALIERGLVRQQQFTWKRCAAETLDVYRRLVK